MSDYIKVEMEKLKSRKRLIELDNAYSVMDVETNNKLASIDMKINVFKETYWQLKSKELGIPYTKIEKPTTFAPRVLHPAFSTIDSNRNQINLLKAKKTIAKSENRMLDVQQLDSEIRNLEDENFRILKRIGNK